MELLFEESLNLARRQRNRHQDKKEVSDVLPNVARPQRGGQYRYTQYAHAPLILKKKT